MLTHFSLKVYIQVKSLIYLKVWYQIFVEYKYIITVFVDEGPRRIENIIAIDASRKNHFTKESVLRDIFKAALGFSSSSSHSSSSSIVTGHWGCGIFGGQKTHKFLQQWVAASIATNVSRLDYSVFGDVKLIEFWQRIIQAIQQKKWTVCDVCKNLLQLADDDDYDEDKDITLSSTKHRHSNYDQFVAKLLAL